jgi:DNA-binding MarR family transcriptional regulator
MDKVIGKDIKCVTNLLRRIHFASPLFKECQNLTGMHGYVLGYLSRECVKRDVFQKDLEAAFEMRRSTASEILKLMERNGLITRIPMESDARLKKIVLTDKAKEFSINIEREFAATEAKIVEGISEEEMRAFSATLDKIKANMLGLLEK